MNSVIVTGAAGFVGSALIKLLLQKGVRVLALDIVEDPSSRLPMGHPLLVYRPADIRDTEKLAGVLKGFEADVFYHFAWIGSAGPLREDLDCQIDNAKTTVALMKLAKAMDCKKFVCAGTIMEFEVFDATYAQGTTPQMSYIYGVGKMLAHALCKPVANKVGIDLVWAYITNTFGVGESSPRLINSTIRKCIHGEPLVFTPGTQNYDFIYIDDVAEAFYLLGEKGIRNKGYLIGSGQAGPLRGFLERLVKVCDPDCKPTFGGLPFTGINTPLETFSIKEIQGDCGFAPKVSFEEAIRRTYEWIKAVEEK